MWIIAAATLFAISFGAGTYVCLSFRRRLAAALAAIRSLEEAEVRAKEMLAAGQLGAVRMIEQGRGLLIQADQDARARMLAAEASAARLREASLELYRLETMATVAPAPMGSEHPPS